MMFRGFINLPNEVILNIAESLRENDLKHLLETCRHLCLLLSSLVLRLTLQDKDGVPALHWGALFGHKSLVKVAGADINSRCPYKMTSLYYAAAQGGMGATKLLLSGGADVHLETRHGDTTLHIAAGAGSQCFIDVIKDFSTGRKRCRVNEHDYERIAKLLLDYGAEVNHQSSKLLRSALHVAVIMQSRRMVLLLLENGADVDLVDYMGFTPLMVEASWSGTYC